MTDSGLLGTAPRQARKGDLIYVLLGCSIPLVLRPVKTKINTFELIGECYVDGYMNGEVFDDVAHGRCALEDICLV